MANLPTSFIITLNGTPIAKNINSDEEQIHAAANHNNPAVFTFSNGLLESDGWYLGRSVIEDRSLLPKRVLWHKKGGEVGEDLIQKTTIEDQGGNLVLTNGGMYWRFDLGLVLMVVWMRNRAKLTDVYRYGSDINRWTGLW